MELNSIKIIQQIPKENNQANAKPKILPVQKLIRQAFKQKKEVYNKKLILKQKQIQKKKNRINKKKQQKLEVQQSLQNDFDARYEKFLQFQQEHLNQDKKDEKGASRPNFFLKQLREYSKVKTEILCKIVNYNRQYQEYTQQVQEYYQQYYRDVQPEQ